MLKILMIAAPVLAFLCILLWNKSVESNSASKQNTHSSRQTRAPDFDVFRDRSTKTNRPEHVAKTPLTPADDPGIKVITDQLKAIEGKRTDFCRREESDSEIFFEYLVKRPDSEEVKEINKLISEASGLTQDQNKQTLTWKQRLSNDFLPSPEFEYYIVGIVYKKNSRRAGYSVSGIPYGKLIMRNGNAPISGDGFAHLICHNIGFKFDTDWRYSHLLNSEPEH